MDKSGRFLLVTLLCLVLLALMIPGGLYASGKGQMQQKGPLYGYCVVVDAGHGGEDGGTLGVHTKCKESDINLAIALYLKTCLESADADVVLTRKNSEALCGTRKYSKQLDMAERKRIIETAHPVVVVSIHCNSYPSFKVKGAQTFYYPDSEEGQKLAVCVQNSLVNLVDPTNKRIPKEADFFMLRSGNATNVLVECGFLSNPEEEKLLLTEEYQQKLAHAVFDGVSAFLTAKE